MKDRVRGTLLGLAAGDALGAGYEFQTPGPERAAMIGGGLGPWDPGEWTDDTQMALCIAIAVADDGFDLDAIGQGFLDWFRAGPKDVGVQTSSVLSAARSPTELTGVARRRFERHPNGSAGNGSLMRTAPVALAHLGDDDAIVAAAREVSALTHGDPLCGDACALWCIAIDRAVREARLDGIDEGLAYLEPNERDRWAHWIAEARTQQPQSFRPNGFVVRALQAALSAIVHTPEDSPEHLELALYAAIRIGDDTDTVAAVAGSVLGARWGTQAIPAEWQQTLHGWPGVDAAALAELASAIARPLNAT